MYSSDQFSLQKYDAVIKPGKLMVLALDFTNVLFTHAGAHAYMILSYVWTCANTSIIKTPNGSINIQVLCAVPPCLFSGTHKSVCQLHLLVISGITQYVTTEIHRMISPRHSPRAFRCAAVPAFGHSPVRRHLVVCSSRLL